MAFAPAASQQGALSAEEVRRASEARLTAYWGFRSFAISKLYALFRLFLQVGQFDACRLIDAFARRNKVAMPCFAICTYDGQLRITFPLADKSLSHLQRPKRFEKPLYFITLSPAGRICRPRPGRIANSACLLFCSLGLTSADLIGRWLT